MKRCMIVLICAISAALAQTSSLDLLNDGVAAYKSGRFSDAVNLFQQAAAADPNNANARLYLATALMSQWVPGADDASNRDLATRSEREFRAVLELQPGNKVALTSLASLAYNQKHFDAVEWNQKIIEVDPSAKEAHYSLGVIAWWRLLPEWAKARVQAGMKPEDPGPLRDFNLRSDLRSRFSKVVEDGMNHLQRALDIDPQYDDAMAYMNLLVRERADWRDTPEEYRADMVIADEWVQKGLDVKKAKLAASGSYAPPPPGGPTRIRVGGNVQAANLVQSVAAEYPPLAKQARVQGTVRYQLVIGRDGRTKELQLVSGHPLLVPSATEAVKQYVYRPTLLNGQPVEVITTVDVEFRLAQ